MLLEEGGEVRQHLDGVRAQVMFDALDVALLGFGSEVKQRKEPGKSRVTPLDLSCDIATLGGEEEATIFFVLQIAQFAELLDHAGDAGPLDLEGGGDVGGTRVTFLLE